MFMIIKRRQPFLYIFLGLCCAMFSHTAFAQQAGSLAKGQVLPNATLLGSDGKPVLLESLKGRIKILSMVPQLNTPVCDEQTHRFSEQNDGLDKLVDIVTISTNSHKDQTHFATKANLHNLTYLSDSPNYDFGKKTGLLIPTHGILQRTVIVADHNNTIRYIEQVPMSQLPNFSRAYEATKKLLKHHEP